MITVSTSIDEHRGYHHGDLRVALVSAGLDALKTTDISNISLRMLARQVGVSATAVYRHFPDKHALIEALADEGVVQLGLWQQEAARQAGDRAFEASGRAYVRFALANPGLFRIIFTHRDTRSAVLREGSLATTMLLQGADGIARGDEQVAQRIAAQAWAMVHGLAMLMLDGHIPADGPLIDQVIDGTSLWQAQP